MRDLDEIADWTVDRFGAAQAQTYAQTLKLALRALRGGPSIPAARSQAEIAAGLFTLHAARGGRRAGHVILFRADPEQRAIEVLRVLHEARDLRCHVPGDYSGGGRSE